MNTEYIKHGVELLTITSFLPILGYESDTRRNSDLPFM